MILSFTLIKCNLKYKNWNPVKSEYTLKTENKTH